MKRLICRIIGHRFRLEPLPGNKGQSEKQVFRQRCQRCGLWQGKEKA